MARSGIDGSSPAAVKTFMRFKNPLLGCAAREVIWKHHRTSLSAGGWFQELPWIPKSTGAQVTYIRWKLYHEYSQSTVSPGFASVDTEDRLDGTFLPRYGHLRLFSRR